MNFDVVFYDSRARLHDLVPTSGIIFREAKTISAYDNTVLQNDIISDLAELANDRMRVRKEVVTDLHPAIDHRMRKQYRGRVKDIPDTYKEYPRRIKREHARFVRLLRGQTDTPDSEVLLARVQR